MEDWISKMASEEPAAEDLLQKPSGKLIGLSPEERQRLPPHIERAFRDPVFCKKVDFWQWIVSFQGTHRIQRLPSKDPDAFLAALLTTDHISESARMAKFFEGDALEGIVRTLEDHRNKSSSNWVELAKARPNDVDWIQTRFLKDISSTKNMVWPNLLDWIQKIGPKANLVPVQHRMAELGMWKELVDITYSYDYVNIFTTLYCQWTMQSNQTRNDRQDGSVLNLILHLHGARRQECFDNICFLMKQVGRGQVWPGLTLWQSELLGSLRQRTRPHEHLAEYEFKWEELENHAIQCWDVHDMELYARHVRREGPVQDFLTVEEIMES